jgi:hypothetical protein
VIVSHAQLAPCPDNLHVLSHSSSSAMCTYGSLCALNPHSDLSSRSVRADSIHVSMMFAHCGRADGTRTAVFDRGSTHVPRRDIVVNGPPPIRLHLSVHVIVHLVIVLWHSIGDGLLWPSCAWGSGRGRLLRVVLMSTAAAAAAAGRDGASGAGGGLPCGLPCALASAGNIIHLKMKIEKETCYERRAYVQERRRNPCDQLCRMYDHGRGHDT